SRSSTMRPRRRIGGVRSSCAGGDPLPVEVRVPTVLRQNAGGQATISANGSNLAEVLEDVVRQFPLMAGKVVTDDGTLHKFVNVYRNDEDVRYLERLDTTVSDDDVISILPAVAGG